MTDSQNNGFMTEKQSDPDGTVQSVPSEVREAEQNETKPSGKRRAKKILLIIASAVLGLVLICAAAFGILYATGRAKLLGYKVNVSVPSDEVDFSEEDGSRVKYNGSTYVYNKNSVNVLFMGIDKNDVLTDLGYGKNGQADSIMVISLDTKTGKINILPISRDTMTDISVYSADGNYIGVRKAQLCTAYSYGASGKESCENVRQAVSRYLYGVEMSAYAAVDMDGVKVLGDAIGGVRLTPIETLEGTAITKGKETVLKGDMINQYLRRRDSDLGANSRRMLRQKQFVEAFASQAGNQVLSDFGKLAKLYNAASPYTVTDIGLSEVTYLASCCLTADVGKSIAYNYVSGETVMGERYMEFHSDKNSVFEAVLNTFYIKENS